MAAHRVPAYNPRLYGNEMPLHLAVGLGEDGVEIIIEEAPGLSSCEMDVALEAGPNVTWAKRITAWNSAIAQDVDTVNTQDANRGPNTMRIRKAWGSIGANEIHLQKWAWSRWMDMYTFDSIEMWASWGGLKVTFIWVGDRYSGSFALQPPQYPVVAYPDGSLVATTPPPPAPAPQPTFWLSRMLSAVAGWRGGRLSFENLELLTPVAYLVFGGAKFPIARDATSTAILNLAGRNLADALIIEQSRLDRLPTAPVDFTLLRAYPDDGKAYIVFGRAKFEFDPNAPIPTQQQINAGAHAPFLATTNGVIHWVPAAAIAAIPNVPRDGTLLMEHYRAYTPVYLVRNGVLFPLSSPARQWELWLPGASSTPRMSAAGSTACRPRTRSCPMASSTGTASSDFAGARTRYIFTAARPPATIRTWVTTLTAT
jgi:hypothetical protein